MTLSVVLSISQFQLTTIHLGLRFIQTFNSMKKEQKEFKISVNVTPFIKWFIPKGSISFSNVAIPIITLLFLHFQITGTISAPRSLLVSSWILLCLTLFPLVAKVIYRLVRTRVFIALSAFILCLTISPIIYLSRKITSMKNKPKKLKKYAGSMYSV